MRAAGGMLGILLTMGAALYIYKSYFSQGQQVSATSAKQTIDVVGVQNDLLAIAQAERAYQAEHSSYASLDDLTSSGAMTMKKAGREGYTYGVETSTDSFRVVARCSGSANPGCTNYAIDQTMEVRAIP